MSLYDVVAHYADGIDLSIAALERRAGISNGSIGRWNSASPSVSNLQKVSDVLGVEVWRLMKEAKKGDGK